MGLFQKKTTLENFFSDKQDQQIVEAIQRAERKTSGEIRVHLERSSKGTGEYLRAKQVFHQLNMDQTERRNGVLFYLAVEDHRFAILGDQGIDDAVPADFWVGIADNMKTQFKDHKYAEGLIAGIEAVGEQLQKWFPWEKDDVNELPDEISYG
ncbi:TPM domain-containing protein [Pontibacter sp. G13]|uniref:TPM domain-containing protein n=1 Tax=Pontibacter sp. G13 TaxID=3074898 RepID=UPI00288ABBBB|nr:TPM domain-containing protein [Pontibacter sp. G13]WNJ19170.1 TPM domain-containing protein [Pontibacter sp. G13]